MIDFVICGSFDNGSKHCCKYCEHFFLWGTSTGRCSITKENVSSWEECDEYKYNEDYSEEDF